MSRQPFWRSPYDRSLHPPRDGTHLLAGEQVRRLAGDRGPGLRGPRRAGRERHHQGGGCLDPRARRLQQAGGRRDRGRDQPRRHRLPHQHGLLHRRRRARRPAQALPLGPLRHDLLRPRRHRPVLPARPGHRHPHRGLQEARRDLQASRLRGEGHPLRRPHPRHPR